MKNLMISRYMEAKLRRQSILTSYLIGTPIGLLTVSISFVLPVMLTGEGLTTVALIGAYGKATVGLIISFFIALGYGGYDAYKESRKQKSLLLVSFKYSLSVNLIIWTVFISIAVIDNFGKEVWLLIVPAIIAFIMCVLGTTFTIGILISSIISRRVKRQLND